MLIIHRYWSLAVLFGALIFQYPALAAQRESVFFSPASTASANINAPAKRLTQKGKVAVSLNPSMAKLKSGAQVELESPNGEIWTVTFDKIVEHTGNSGQTWLGFLSEYGLEYRVILTVSGDIINGRINTPDGILEIAYENGGSFLIDPKMAGMQPVQRIEDDGIKPPPELKNAIDPFAGATGQELASASAKVLSTIDVLVLYSPDFAARYPGSQLQNRLNFLLSLANTAYADSQIEINKRIVGAIQVNYSDTISNRIALDAITDNTISGVDVHALRNTHGADLVVLIRPYRRPDHGSCGVAWVSDSTPISNLGFSVVSDGGDENGSNFFCDQYTFAHEMGHNEGSTHDRANSTVTPAFPYSYGYGIENNFGTIMSYINPPIGRFSNPNTTCSGVPCGIASGASAADNARSLTNTKASIAAFRATSTASNVTLTAQKTGNGTITSLPSGINCGASCSMQVLAGTSVTLTASPAPGNQFNGWSNCPSPNGDQCTITVNNNATVSANFSALLGTLAQAVDNAALSINTSGNTNWFVQNSIVQVGGTAAQSGAISHSGVSHMDTTVTGPGTVSFFWAVSSEAGFDFLRFFVNGVEQAQISGDIGWSQQTFNLNNGSNNLRWSYTKDVSVNQNSDAGWVDAISVVTQSNFNLNVQKTGNGTVTSNTGISCGSICTQTLPQGSNVALTATPSAGNQFSSWSNCPSPNGDVCSLTLNANTTVSANFTPTAPTSATLNILKSGFGTVSSNTGINCGPVCTQNLAIGTSVTLSATASAGNQFLSWSNCPTPNGAQCNVILNVNRTVSATFTADPMVINPPEQADLGGDGKADIVLRDSRTGDQSMFAMNGNIPTLLPIGSLDQAWRIVGVGDLGGDGKADLVIRHNNGVLGMYEMNNNQRIYRQIGGLSLAWKVVGVDDLNGDGNADIVIRNQNNGQLYVYFMNNNVSTGANIGALPLVWAVIGVRDLGADGKADIILRHTINGQLFMFEMNGNQVSGRNIGGLNPIWAIAALGDTNGDGQHDLILRHTNSGQLYLYQMNNHLRTGFNIGMVSLLWSVIGSADFNGDNRDDLLLRHNNTGQLFLLQMNNHLRTNLNIGSLNQAFLIDSPSNNKE